MSDNRHIHAVNAIEVLLEGKDHQRLIDVLAEQLHASLPPRPELRADVVHHCDAALAHLAGYTPIEGRRVDDDSELRMFGISGADQFSEEPVNFREMTEDLGNADDREVFGVDDDFAAGGMHAV